MKSKEEFSALFFPLDDGLTVLIAALCLFLVLRCRLSQRPLGPYVRTRSAATMSSAVTTRGGIWDACVGPSLLTRTDRRTVWVRQSNPHSNTLQSPSGETQGLSDILMLSNTFTLWGERFSQLFNVKLVIVSVVRTEKTKVTNVGVNVRPAVILHGVIQIFLLEQSELICFSCLLPVAQVGRRSASKTRPLSLWLVVSWRKRTSTTHSCT